MKHEPTVFVIDHDEIAREEIRSLLQSVELPVESFSTAQEMLLAVSPDRPGCLIVDTRLPGMSGLELQQRLAEWPVPPPVIVITSHGDIPTAVQAMRAGALDFLEKPYRPQVLLDRVYEALEADAAERRAYERRAVFESRAQTLTPRELQVMKHVVVGMPNKAIAGELGVSRKAVEAYRARMMRKMQARSLAELVRMSILLEGHPGALASAEVWLAFEEVSHAPESEPSVMAGK
jgi:FixJ family two-component response regulator